MTKTPMWGNARLILNVHLEHNTLNFIYPSCEEGGVR